VLFTFYLFGPFSAHSHRGLDVDMDLVPDKNSSEEKKKKKKKKKTAQESEGGANTNQTASTMRNQEIEEKESEAKSSQVRTFPNGLVIEEVAMGKPDGKRASPGKQVTLC
jgi:FK506-binding nuclear protein